VRNIHSIQVLRAIAAIGVVLVHAGIDFNYWGHASINWHLRGAAGVDLFFVISGFVMVYISKPHFGQGDTWMTFILRRIIRIVPLYWLVTTFYAFSGGHPLHQIISSYLFIPDVEGAPPLLAQGWTLRYEHARCPGARKGTFLRRSPRTRILAWSLGRLGLLRGVANAAMDGARVHGRWIYSRHRSSRS